MPVVTHWHWVRHWASPRRKASGRSQLKALMEACPAASDFVLWADSAAHAGFDERFDPSPDDGSNGAVARLPRPLPCRVGKRGDTGKRYKGGADETQSRGDDVPGRARRLGGRAVRRR